MIVLKNSQDLSLEIEDNTTEYGKNIVAREIARSALNMAIAEAQRDFENAADNLDIEDKPYQGGAFTITPIEASSASLRLDVVANYFDASYAIDATLVMASPVDAALIVEAPDAVPTINGTSFIITGVDTPPPTSYTSTPGLDRNGIRTNLPQVRDAFRTEVGSSRVQNVQGVNGDGDIVSGPFEANLQEIYSEAKLNPDRTLAAGHVAGSYGTVNSPEIVVVDGNTVVTGTLQGVGMLIIDGSLTINGSLDWEGLIMVRDTEDLEVRNNGVANIYGSVVLLQGTSAFTMPFAGRLHISYLYSSAGFQSSVNIHPYGMSAEEVFSKGSNRNGDQLDMWDQVYEQGTQMNFFIRTWPAWGVGAGLTYDHYARGHESPVSGHPYADVEQVSETLWRIGFEDLDEEVGYSADWDYDDQVIEVEVIPDEGAESEAEEFTQWWTYEDGEADEDDEDDDGDHGNGHAYGHDDDDDEDDSDGPDVVEFVTGNSLSFRINGNTNIYYSSEAIARLGNKLNSIHEAIRVVVTERWENDPVAASDND